jgi:3-phenylpropionate/trans-cinnamate dioxygenase ferredoxin reductase subunit
MDRIVVVGAGLAGGVVVAALREHGFRGRIALVGAEKMPPYSRPPLSKQYLRGEHTQPELVNPSSVYADVDLKLETRATRIDPKGKRVMLESGGEVLYDRLLVATGGRNRSIDVPGAQLEGVFQLRTLEDSNRIRAVARPGARAAIAGMGFIGCEVAASLRQLGVEVTAIARGSGLLASLLGDEVGAELAKIHREHGVHLLLDDAVTSFEGCTRVERVHTRRGATLDCDFAVVAIGTVPNIELLAEAGAGIQNGVLVDEVFRTSLPDVYAAGDIANIEHHLFGRSRVEHWNNAFHQGHSAALSMLGEGKPYDYVHTIWSDQYEHSIEYVGYAPRWDRVTFDGTLASRRCLAFYLREGRLQAVMGLNRGGDPEDATRECELKTYIPLIDKSTRH